MSLPIIQNEVYKNAPLTESVYEIRFNPILTIESDRNKFYNRIKDSFSKITIPKSNIEPYRFDKPDGSWTVLLSPILIAVSCKRYEGFQTYKKECLKLLSIFSEIFKIEKIIRSGLRYINIIPFTREEGLIPLKAFLNIEINLPQVIPSTFKGASFVFVSQLEKGSITTKVEPVISQDQSKEAIILDFDYVKENDLDIKHLNEYLDESHAHTKALFEGLVTENYLKIMRGDVVS